MSARAITGVILAGGESKRFGSDKAGALLLGRPLLQWVADALVVSCTRIVVLASEKQELPGLHYDRQVRVVRDATSFRGPLRALAGLPDLETDWSFLASGDAPLLRPELIELLIARCPGQAAVVPRVGGRLQPLTGLYSAGALARLREAAENGEARLTAAAETLGPLVLDEDELRAADPAFVSFLNINTPAELQRAEELVRSGFN